MKSIKLFSPKINILVIFLMICLFQTNLIYAQKKGIKDSTGFSIKIDSGQQVSLTFELKNTEYVRIYVYKENDDLVYVSGHFGRTGLNSKLFNAQYHHKGKYNVVIKNKNMDIRQSFTIN